MKKVKHLIVKSTDGTKIAITLCPAVVDAFKHFKENGSSGFDISVPAETIPDVKACVAEMVTEIQGDTRLTIELTETAVGGASPDSTTKLSVRFRQQTDSDITTAAAAATTTTTTQ